MGNLTFPFPSRSQSRKPILGISPKGPAGIDQIFELGSARSKLASLTVDAIRSDITHQD